jgi:3-phenylpropionate/trans-cinnamate dioxygenase ferredoxin subunit
LRDAQLGVEQVEGTMVEVCRADEVALGEAKRVIVAGRPIAVFHAENRWYAIDDTCTHQDASLAEGYLEGCLVECPLHASFFDLRTGAVTSPPAKRPVKTYYVEVRDGRVEIDHTRRGATT